MLSFDIAWYSPIPIIPYLLGLASLIDLTPSIHLPSQFIRTFNPSLSILSPSLYHRWNGALMHN